MQTTTKSTNSVTAVNTRAQSKQTSYEGKKMNRLSHIWSQRGVGRLKTSRVKGIIPHTAYHTLYTKGCTVGEEMELIWCTDRSCVCARKANVSEPTGLLQTQQVWQMATQERILLRVLSEFRFLERLVVGIFTAQFLFLYLFPLLSFVLFSFSNRSWSCSNVFLLQ